MRSTNADERAGRCGGLLDGTIRVLFPLRCNGDSRFAARVLGRIVHGRAVDITLACDSRQPPPVRNPLRISYGPRAGTETRSDEGSAESDDRSASSSGDCLDGVIAHLLGPQTDLSVVGDIEPSNTDAVLTEAKGYDLLVLGASERARPPDERSFEGAIDGLMGAAPCPSLIVGPARGSDEPTLENEGIRRLLLPIVEGEYNRCAAEIAFAIASGSASLVTIVHWSHPPPSDGHLIRDRYDHEGVTLDKQVVDRVAGIGLESGATVLTDVSVSDRLGREIVARAVEDETDLIVLGSEPRSWSRRPVLAPWATDVIRNAPCPVAVVGARDEPETVPTRSKLDVTRGPTLNRIGEFFSEGI